MIKKEIKADFRSTLGGLLAKPAFNRVKKTMDYTEVGGAPLLGLKGLVGKVHGNAKKEEIISAILQCKTFVENNVSGKIIEGLAAQDGEQ